MITMPGCTDTICKDCFKRHFSVVIAEKSVKHFNCPMCDQPDMTDLKDGTQDMYQMLFVQLVSSESVVNSRNLHLFLSLSPDPSACTRVL